MGEVLPGLCPGYKGHARQGLAWSCGWMGWQFSWGCRVGRRVWAGLALLWRASLPFPGNIQCPWPWSCGQHSVSAWSKPSSGAQRRCLSSPSTASSRPACPKWQLTGAPWVPTALAAALIPAGCALSPQNRTGWDMRAPEAAGNFPSLW